MTRADELRAIMGAVVAGNYAKDQSETESCEIDEVLREGFKMAFDPQCRTIYGVK